MKRCAKYGNLQPTPVQMFQISKTLHEAVPFPYLHEG